MARPKSPEKRSAILQAAVEEIAQAGLGAATADIARRAGVASGTLFSYFSTKDELLGELYLELKREVYACINAEFPARGSLEVRARHVWSSFLSWALEFPDKRRVSLLLNVSDRLSPEVRAAAAALSGPLAPALAELEQRAARRGLPQGFATAFMGALQEATMEFALKEPKRRARLIENAFAVYWRAFR